MKNYLKLLIPFLAITLVATSCKKDEETKPDNPPIEEETDYLSADYTFNVSLTPMQGNAEGVEFKTTFAAGDQIEITNPQVLYEPLTISANDNAGKSSATFTGKIKIKKDVDIASGIQLTAVLKNGDNYNSGKPFVDVKKLTSLADNINKYSYWSCENFTFKGGSASINLAQSTVFVKFNTISTKLSLKHGNAFKDEIISGENYFAVSSGTKVEIASLNFEQTLGEDGKLFYNISCTAPDKCVSALFSVGENKAVYFSNGNLQYRPMDGAWRLAPQQNHKCFSEKIEVGEDYADWQGEDKWTDLFWWGTWIEGSFPYRISDNIFETYDLPLDANNELTSPCAFGAEWTVLSLDEWTYLLQTRPDADTKHGGAYVDGIPGWVILPDAWSTPEGIAPVVARFDVKYETDVPNNYTAEQLSKMEAAGAVFLPLSGFFMSITISPSDFTDYQTRSLVNLYGEVIGFEFLNSTCYCGDVGMFNAMGASVRLVQVPAEIKVKVE